MTRGFVLVPLILLATFLALAAEEMPLVYNKAGEIVATDNGDPTDFTVFASHNRKAFNGLALVIVRAKPGQRGGFVVRATAEGLQAAGIFITAR